MKIKLRNRIVLGLLCIFLLAVTIGAYSIVTMQRLANISWDLQVLIALDNSIKEVLEDVHIWRYELVAAIVFETDFTNSLTVEYSAFGLWHESPNATWIYDEQLDVMIGQLAELNEQLHDATRQLVLWQRGGLINYALLVDNLYQGVMPLAEETIVSLQAIGDRYASLIYEQAAETLELQNASNMLVVAICLIALVVFLFASYFIVRSIIRPIRNVTTAADELALGNLNVNIPKYEANDEIGRLNKAISSLVGVVKDLVVDLNTLAGKNTKDGDIDYRIEASKYKNSFMRLAERVNNIVDDQTENMLLLLNAVNKVADGDFNVTVRELPGKKIMITEAVRSVVAKLDNLHESISVLTANASDGLFDTRIDSTEFGGNWAVLVGQLNKLMSSIEEPLAKINHNIRIMAEGDFSHLEDDYPGEFGKLLESCNIVNNTTEAYISDISHVVRSIASGDLTVSIKQDFRGSYLPIKVALGSILDNLNLTLSGIQEVSDQIASGSSQISEAAAQLASDAAHQTSEIDKLNDSITIIYDKAIQASKDAATANESVSLTREHVVEGGNAVNVMSNTMNKLNESSKNIGKIIDVINGIAFQTNLLALNASVEAARAGEHGRGFSVVADEVRSLASRSQQATSDTGTIIAEDEKYVADSQKSTEAVVSSFDIISGNMNEITHHIDDIARISTDQLGSITDIQHSISEITRVATSTALAAEESASLARGLDDQTNTLKGKVSYFKLKGM